MCIWDIKKSFRILMGIVMINDYWIVSVFGVEYNFRIVKAFRIFIQKGKVNDYLIVCVFEIVSEFEM